MNHNNRQAVMFMILCTIFTSLGQILWKFGVGQGTFNFAQNIFNIPFLLGCLSYGTGLLFMLLSFRKGELSVLYPILATSYIWVSLLSPIIFPTDAMNSWKWSGVVVILLSVSILGLGSRSGKRSRVIYND